MTWSIYTAQDISTHYTIINFCVFFLCSRRKERFSSSRFFVFFSMKITNYFPKTTTYINHIIVLLLSRIINYILCIHYVVFVLMFLLLSISGQQFLSFFVGFFFSCGETSGRESYEVSVVGI